MKAVIFTNYGPPDVLELREIDKPAPKDDEVLIKVYATSVTAGEIEIRTLKLPLWLRLPMQLWLGFRKPRKQILGQELAGVIEETGKNVTSFRKGDAVFGTTGFHMGANGQYVCLSVKPQEGTLAKKPVNVSFEEAAVLPVAGLEALYFLRRGKLQSGQKVLVVGAGGSIGTFAVQLARYFGAEVTGVDKAEKLDMVRSIGANHVIDFTQEDFTKNGEAYDVIFDVIGKSPFYASLKSLKPNGRYLLANPSLSDMLRGRWVSMKGNKQVIFGASNQSPEDLLYLGGLLEERKIKSIIDRIYPLEDVVEAHRYAESGQKKGNITVTVHHEENG
ncbi:MAG: NAD(P)-dependent alcohol dehydrogenase [Candidatus Bathyarchaeia archaeon]